MELTDVDFSFQKFYWLFENNETDQGDCSTAFGCFKKKTNNFFLYLDCTWMAGLDCQFLSFTTDFEMSETYELLSGCLRGCIMGHIHNMCKNNRITTLCIVLNLHFI